MLKFTEWPKTLGITSKKAWLSLKGISGLQVTFVLIWIKQTLIWFNWQRDGTGNGLSNTEDTFAESLQLQFSVLYQSMCILKQQGWSLKFIWWISKILRKSIWCVRSQSKWWNYTQFQTQVYINQRFIHEKGAEKLVNVELIVPS